MFIKFAVIPILIIIAVSFKVGRECEKLFQSKEKSKKPINKIS